MSKADFLFSSFFRFRWTALPKSSIKLYFPLSKRLLQPPNNYFAVCSLIIARPRCFPSVYDQPIFHVFFLPFLFVIRGGKNNEFFSQFFRACFSELSLPATSACWAASFQTWALVSVGSLRGAIWVPCLNQTKNFIVAFLLSLFYESKPSRASQLRVDLGAVKSDL